MYTHANGIVFPLAVEQVVLGVSTLKYVRSVESAPILVALGIAARGEKKHVLGVSEDATKNTVCCAGLLSNLEARGVSTKRSMLFVVDVSKAPRKAILAKFGPWALVQRCQVHQRRNVL